MTGNPIPWLILCVIVAATLLFKGYLKLPALAGGRPAPPPSPSPDNAAAPPLTPAHGPNVDLSQYPAFALGHAFVLAAKREADQHLAYRIADKHAADMRAAFIAPFSPPAAPATPGPPPSSP